MNPRLLQTWRLLTAPATVLPGKEIQDMKIEWEQEDDGRWIAEAPAIPGALAYGITKTEAISKVEALVLRILADRLEQGEATPELEEVFTVAA